MFEHFTFGAQSQNQHDDVSASPTDISFSSPPSAFPFYDEKLSDLSDIVQKLNQQSLDHEKSSNSFVAWEEATRQSFEVDDEMLYLTPTVSAPIHDNSRSSIACRRLQRQLNTQLQLSTSHIRDLKTLMEDMIDTSSQCRLYSPTMKYLAADPAEVDHQLSLEIDEGFSEPLDTDTETSLRRASSPSGIRKCGIKYARSGDSVGRMRVRSMPRMRKQKTMRARE